MDTFLDSLVQSCCVEEGMLQTNNNGMCLQCLRHTGSAPAQGACALPAHTAQALGCSTGNRPRPALAFMHLPGLSRSGSGTQVVLRGADLVGPAFCGLPMSEHLGCLASAVTVAYRPSRPCCSAFWVYRWRPFSGGWCLSRAPGSLS